MKTIIQGRNIEITYFISKGKNGRPYIDEKTEIVSWADILTIDGTIGYNSSLYKCINLNEKEEVMVDREIFRADLNAMVVRIRKNLSVKEIDHDKTKIEFDFLLKKYNKDNIESDEQLSLWCKLNNKNAEEIDADELKKLIKKESVTSMSYTDLIETINKINNLS